MPLESMGSFETFCRCLPFYPSVILGRIATGFSYTVSEGFCLVIISYDFDRTARLGLIPIFLFLAAAIVLSFVLFRHQMKRDN